MIIMNDVIKRYRMGNETVSALDGVSLRVDAGEFVAIIGPSGSGKSTLMNIIGCLDVADAGEYELDGKPIGRYNERALARVRSEKIGFVFQGFNLLPKLNALENVELPLVYQNVAHAERRRRALQALEHVGLQDRLRHRPSELSGGQQQRVAVARALCGSPSLILADEPTGNLDSHTGREIIELFRKLNQQGNTILLITHDTNVASQASRQIRIEDGRIKGGIA